MTDLEILREAERIMRAKKVADRREQEMYRDAATALLWARADLAVEQVNIMKDMGATVIALAGL